MHSEMLLAREETLVVVNGWRYVVQQGVVEENTAPLVHLVYTKCEDV